MRALSRLLPLLLLALASAALAFEPFVLVPAPGQVVVDGRSNDWDLSGAYGPVSFDPELFALSNVWALALVLSRCNSGG